MQYHFKKLVEIINGIDGFKEFCDNIIPKIKRIGEYCYGRIKRKRVLQTGYC